MLQGQIACDIRSDIINFSNVVEWYNWKNRCDLIISSYTILQRSKIFISYVVILMYEKYISFILAPPFFQFLQSFSVS